MKILLSTLALSGIILVVLAAIFPFKRPDTTLNKTVMHYIQEAEKGFNNIPEERKESLKELAQFVQKKTQAGEEAQLIFICTHNSRRSHMGQLWANVAAHHYQIPQVQTYSGGTEATAFNPRAVAALERAGMKIKKISDGENPRYHITFASDVPAQEAFSKKYDDPANPGQGFAAIMTCSQADEACPYVPGAELRLSLPYEDPKEADGTPQEANRYDERSQQIATEMLYCFSQVQPKMQAE
uniref:Protein-tyrosine-phosphatase n=1 Tax=Roseihalotalea indica TaxID=2867963 RepID=A0AA49JH95_9BACT|nr:protein-tyrosine-phosphatase [Tunicatimonas sp. TK19036]